MTQAPERRRFVIGCVLVVLGAVFFAGKAVIVKLAYGYQADPVSLLGLRMAFAAPLFVLGIWFADRQRKVALTRRELWTVLLMGFVGYYLSSFLDFLGLQYVSAGLERVILYLNPTMVLLISAFTLGRRIVGREWVALAVAYSGVWLMYSHDVRIGGPDVPLGSLLVLASAATYAVYLVVAGEMVRRLGALRLTSYASLAASVFCVAQALAWAPQAMFRQQPAVYGLSLVNASLCTAVPLFLTMAGIERMGSATASMVGMVGPIATIALAAVFLGEPVTVTQLAGTAVVIGGISLLTTRKA